MAVQAEFPIYQLIGSPIVAMVQAEALVAQATAEFIETVGFVKDNNSGKDSFGRLKTVVFSYKKQNTNGEDHIDQIELPILSLIPIPVFQIKDSSLEFNLRLTSIGKLSIKERERNVTSPNQSYLDDHLISLRGVFAGFPDVTGGKGEGIDLKIKMNVGQSDIPTGIAKIFQVFDIAVNSKNIK